jgi:hypothetical protein
MIYKVLHIKLKSKQLPLNTGGELRCSGRLAIPASCGVRVAQSFCVLFRRPLFVLIFTLCLSTIVLCIFLWFTSYNYHLGNAFFIFPFHFGWLMLVTSFSCGRSRSTRRELPTMDKQLVTLSLAAASRVHHFVIYKAGHEPTPDWW